MYQHFLNNHIFNRDQEKREDEENKVCFPLHYISDTQNCFHLFNSEISSL